MVYVSRLIPVNYGPRNDIDAISERYMTQITKMLGFRLKDWQAHAFETLRKGRDLLIKAGTGAGKTAAILSMLALKPEGTILVIVPTKSIMSDAVPSFARIHLTH
jgi:ATP-dependent helicase YprA (DUF1998 family)